LGQKSAKKFDGNIDLVAIVLTWFTMSYVAYRRVEFDQWSRSFSGNIAARWYKNVGELIETIYRPLIRNLSTVDEVSLAARELITESKSKSVFMSGKIVFLGAAANQSDKSRRDSLAISEDSERTPAQVYQGAVEEVMSNLSPVYRVISLLTLDEYRSRSLSKRRQYNSWLRNQISQLKRNKNYILFDNKRAPKWGASGASIFTSSGFLHFTSAGGDALFVKDERLSSQLISSVMSEIGRTSQSSKRAFTQMENDEYSVYSGRHQFGQNIPAEELNKHMELLVGLA
jgi:hypothetical protein